MALIPRSIRPKRRRLAIANLKRCPLCGAVNAQQNDSCFACGWHGLFDKDPEIVEEGLNQLIDRCPELANAANLEPQKQNFWQWLRSLFHRRLDLQA